MSGKATLMAVVMKAARIAAMELVRSTWLLRTESAALVSKRDVNLLTIRRTMTVSGRTDKIVRYLKEEREEHLSRCKRGGNMNSERCSHWRAPFVMVTAVH